MRTLVNKPSYIIKVILRLNGGSLTDLLTLGNGQALGLLFLNIYNTVSRKVGRKKKYDFSGIKTTNGRPYSSETLSVINDLLSYIPEILRAVIMANIVEESGADPLASNSKYMGLLQWEPTRYTISYNDPQKELKRQILYIIDTADNIADRVSWTHGGKGSGYKTALLAYDTFKNGSLEEALRAYTLGYVRPLGKIESANNRLKVAKQIYDILTR